MEIQQSNDAFFFSARPGTGSSTVSLSAGSKGVSSRLRNRRPSTVELRWNQLGDNKRTEYKSNGPRQTGISERGKPTKSSEAQLPRVLNLSVCPGEGRRQAVNGGEELIAIDVKINSSQKVVRLAELAEQRIFGLTDWVGIDLSQLGGPQLQPHLEAARPSLCQVHHHCNVARHSSVGRADPDGQQLGASLGWQDSCWRRSTEGEQVEVGRCELGEVVLVLAVRNLQHHTQHHLELGSSEAVALGRSHHPEDQSGELRVQNRVFQHNDREPAQEFGYILGDHLLTGADCSIKVASPDRFLEIALQKLQVVVA